MTEVNQKIVEFISSFRTVILATSKQGAPHASVAPILIHENRFYFLISEVAEHYQNIINHPSGELFFVEDEAIARSPFFRKRITLAVSYAVSNEQFIEDQFANAFGEMVHRMIQQMDFHIIEAIPSSGKAVFGAGEAYLLNQNLQVNKQDTGSGMGHRQNKKG